MSKIISSKRTEKAIKRKTEIESESQVIVHCCFENKSKSEILIRIWPSTFLVDQDSNYRSKLVHCEKISLYPTWMSIDPMQRHNFSLIFSGLPRSCKSFNLIEMIPQKGGFEVNNIQRNQIDVYHVKI